MSIQSELKKEYKDLVGEIKLNYEKNFIMLSGNVFLSDKKGFMISLLDKIDKKYPNKVLSNNLCVNEFIVIEDEVSTNKEYKQILDEVNVLYYGYLNTNHIKPNTEFKLIHERNRDKLDNCVRALNFITPIVLNSNLEVIDGNFRLQLAEANDIKKVLVVVIDDNGKRADFLRLALNRTSEFQRWNYREVDEYVDNTPQAQPILEAIGFFGKKVLPTSFFSDTVIKYEIDPFNEKQKQYSQEEGLAEWAKYRREQMSTLSAQKRAKVAKPANAVSLFDLSPKAEDFLETYDIDEEMNNFVDKYKKLGEKITKEQDEIKRAEIEANGGEWQNKHRTPKQVARDNRKNAISKIQDSDVLSDYDKLEIIANLDDYIEHLDDHEKLTELLKKGE